MAPSDITMVFNVKCHWLSWFGIIVWKQWFCYHFHEKIWFKICETDVDIRESAIVPFTKHLNFEHFDPVFTIFVMSYFTNSKIPIGAKINDFMTYKSSSSNICGKRNFNKHQQPLQNDLIVLCIIFYRILGILNSWSDKILQYISNHTYDINGLGQDCNKSIANSLELLQPCAKPLIYYFTTSTNLFIIAQRNFGWGSNKCACWWFRTNPQ